MWYMASKRRLATCVISAQALIVAFTACRGGAGKSRLSEPSGSAAVARSLGVFLNRVKLEANDAGSATEHLRVDEAWLEEVVERFESVPIRRKVSGTRLCIRLARTAKPRPPGAIDAQMTVQNLGEVVPVQDATIFTRDAIVVSFTVNADRDFPKKGKVSISDPSTLTEVAHLSFSVVESKKERAPGIGGGNADGVKP